ncbi:MAG: RdgB/HAM1 family non-canonical purine NTP pyrophosphatase [Oscillospiraceae bacterium]|jgi:XTP/dITP diphosphohydrolase|nr:RdgB/HAM1 family non-canonical purine NTP pyrophosphatase [Oscillospiraceae bacterium]
MRDERFVLASHNPGKLAEMRDILGELGIRVISQREAGVDVEPEETGETFEENAVIKAVAVMKACGLPAVADDSGLAVDALGGAPGVYSARYGGGHDRSDADRNAFLLKNMENEEHRGAKYVSVIAVAYPDGRVITARGECRGEIAREEKGAGGFGYDPLFLLPDGRHMAELSKEEKNRISHRGNALRELKRKLTEQDQK